VLRCGGNIGLWVGGLRAGALAAIQKLLVAAGLAAGLARLRARSLAFSSLLKRVSGAFQGPGPACARCWWRQSEFLPESPACALGDEADIFRLPRLMKVALPVWSCRFTSASGCLAA